MKFSELPYQRIDINEVKTQFNDLINAFESAESAAAQAEIIKEINELRSEFDTLSTIVSVRHSINTKDEFYEGEHEFFNGAMPEYESYVTRFYKALTNSKFEKELRTELGDLLFDMAHVQLKTFQDDVIPNLTKENQLFAEYTKLTAGAQIEFEGKTHNLSSLSPLIQSLDRDLRKRALDARNSFFEKNQDEFDRIYDELVQVRTEIAKQLGYKNFVELGYNRMKRTDYTAKEVAQFRANIEKHFVPFVEQLKAKQAKRIGVDHLKYYDESLNYKTGNASPKGDPEWILDNGSKMYNELSDETKEFFQFMTDGEFLDLVNKDGKAPGGYCTMFQKYGAPFIFSNFNGTSHDIDVLTHEAGHAFQIYSSREMNTPEYMWPTYEACEIHSMSMEFFTWPWMESFFKEDTAKYKWNHIASAVSNFPTMATVDEFQHEVYSNPNMTPVERRAKFAEISKKYRPSSDSSESKFLSEGGGFFRILHIFGMPFYYIDYALAQICALQFWVKMQEDYKGAWQAYVKLCKAGGSMSFLKLVEYAGLKSPFEEATITEVIEKASAYLNSIDDTKL